jgi:enolase
MDADQLIDLYDHLAQKYPIKSIEDPFDQDDFAAYIKMTARLGKKIQIVGDDLLVTNPKRVQTGID